jgi:Flp pilus assembly protein TadG
MTRADGQSTVEVIGLLPLLLAVGLGVFAFLSAGAAREAASGAAEAGAVALLQGRDARAAARAALPGWPRRRTRITVAGRRVRVSVTPSGPLGARLRATASAEAGVSPSTSRLLLASGGPQMSGLLDRAAAGGR